MNLQVNPSELIFSYHLLLHVSLIMIIEVTAFFKIKTFKYLLTSN